MKLLLEQGKVVCTLEEKNHAFLHDCYLIFDGFIGKKLKMHESGEISDYKRLKALISHAERHGVEVSEEVRKRLAELKETSKKIEQERLKAEEASRREKFWKRLSTEGCGDCPYKKAIEWEEDGYVHKCQVTGEELRKENKPTYGEDGIYTDVYPSSKAYGLYYTQGQKNIGGFFFKEPNARGPVFEQYAIVNILRTVTGNPNLTIDKTNYTKLCFELEYIPVYSARVGHGKQYVGDWLKFPRTLAHNQSGNMVETQYYGENIKGTAERLGTIEKSYTFTAFNLNTIPEAGQLWDEDYYIATVSVEVNQDRFRCTVGLSKNFNRISQYIGANSYRRIFEVSERMVQERQSIYTDYLVITDKAAPVPAFRENFLCNNANFYDNLLSEFYGESVSQICGKVSAVFIRGETKNGKETLPKIILPVISSAFGNVMEFSWEFKDNFSAGMRAVEVTSGNITGTFGQEVQYCDYYGRMYYENFELWSIFDNDISYGAEMSYPLLEKYVADSEHAYYVAHTNTGYPLIKRKDSREALKENYAIEFVTDIKGVVVGSALASTNPLVSGLKPKEKAVFVILNRPINKFSRKINIKAGNIAAQYEIGANGFDISCDTYIDENRMGSVYLECTGTTATVAGKAWAFMTPVYEGEPYTVENEDGNVSTITPKYGGELLFGRNIDIKNGDNVGAFRIVGTHDVFDYLKQKEALI